MSDNSPAPKPPENQPAQPGPGLSAPPAPETKTNGERGRKFNSPKFIWPAAIALAVILYFVLAYVADVFTHESTDDAFITGHIVSIAPQISGPVAAVQVLDNQLVHSNDLLVEINPADYAVVVGQKTAAAASSKANFDTIIAAYELMRAKVVTAEAATRVAVADAAAAAATADNAQANLDRAQDLLKQKTVSQQEFDATSAANIEAQADLKSAQENVDEQNSKVDEARKQLAAAFAEKDMAFAQFTEAETNIAAAQLNLSYTKLFAPCDGRVTRKQVEVGDYLQAGQQIMSIVPQDVWVVANFKESQLEKMRPGQPALVAVDALGGREFRAHVDSIQAGSGAAFSLLPPENATGNFVKVVQRVPVKILFDEPLPADHVFGPGLSVTPSVLIDKEISPWPVALAAVVLSLVVVITLRFFLNRKK